MRSRVSEAMPDVTVEMMPNIAEVRDEDSAVALTRRKWKAIQPVFIPGKSTRTIRCNPGPLTAMEITLLEMVVPPATEARMRISISRRNAASSLSLVKSNSRVESWSEEMR